MEGLSTALRNQFSQVPQLEHPEGDFWQEDTFFTYLQEEYQGLYDSRRQEVGEELMDWFQRMVLLERIDSSWKGHLLNMDHLREGIGLRGYGQRDPLTEYKREGFSLFDEMVHNVKIDAIRSLFFYKPVVAEGPVRRSNANVKETHADSQGMPARRSPAPSAGPPGEPPQKVATVRRDQPKVGRNDPCPCGSGKKYKKCCGV